jgi:transcriptional regulator with XRE-family HTH domain
MADDDEQDAPDDEAAELTEHRFAANLRAAREAAGMSQGRLADEMVARGWPWHQQTVTRVETGRRMVRLGEAKAAAEILQTSLDRLTWPTSDARTVELLAALTRTAKAAFSTIAKETTELLRAADELRRHPVVAGIDPTPGKLVQDAVNEAREVLRLTPDGAVACGVADMSVAIAFQGVHGRKTPTFQPGSIDEAEEIAVALRRGEIVIVDLAETPADQVQRIRDFLNGAVRVHGGTVKPAGDLRYRAMPAAWGQREWALAEIPGTVTDLAPEGRRSGEAGA